MRRWKCRLDSGSVYFNITNSYFLILVISIYNIIRIRVSVVANNLDSASCNSCIKILV